MPTQALQATTSPLTSVSTASLAQGSGFCTAYPLMIKKLGLDSLAFYTSAVVCKVVYPAAAVAVLGGLSLAIHRYFQNWLGSKFVNLPKMNMRELPSASSRVVSQVVLGDQVEVEKTSWGRPTSWSYIKTADGYKGWVRTSGLVDMSSGGDPKMSRAITKITSRSGGYLYTEKDTEFGPKLVVPYGSKLRLVDTSDARWAIVALPDGKKFYIQKGDIAEERPITNRKELVLFAKSFLGKHFVWGGKSGDEFDSSGFVQMLYNAIGVLLPRDSKDQIRDPRFKRIAQNSVRPGDLVFFGRDSDHIRGVGMCLGDGKFIHATVVENQPWVRISHLDESYWNGTNPLLPYRIFRTLKT